MFETDSVVQFFEQLTKQRIEITTSPIVYAQLGMILLAVIVALSLTTFLKRHSPALRSEPSQGPLLALRRSIYGTKDLLFPVLNILALTIAVVLGDQIVETSWLIRIAASLAVILLISKIITRYIHQETLKKLVKWIVIPIAILEVFGWLDDVTAYLDTVDANIGNIRISLYGVIRVIIFGSILFFLGRALNKAGKNIIRRQTDLHAGTREVLAKLFEATLVVIVFILLLQATGINLTALAVFGGALGVGIGLGLQPIASSFISGIIILLDRSISLGDYVELEDGVAGTVRDMNMRSAVLETFDGRDILVPNERFLNGNVVNWTHKDDRQRYSFNFHVAYDTDLDNLFEIVREVCASHPKVLSGPGYTLDQQPDAEIQSFDDSGINILVEFWMQGIDDGKNRVGADLLHLVWRAMRENDINFPFPQREVRILNENIDFSDKADQSV